MATTPHLLVLTVDSILSSLGAHSTFRSSILEPSAHKDYHDVYSELLAHLLNEVCDRISWQELVTIKLEVLEVLQEIGWINSLISHPQYQHLTVPGRLKEHSNLWVKLQQELQSYRDLYETLDDLSPQEQYDLGCAYLRAEFPGPDFREFRDQILRQRVTVGEMLALVPWWFTDFGQWEQRP